jgi:excisionase family DNA binding protein
MSSDFMTVAEVAPRINRSLSGTYLLAKRGDIPAVKIGGSVRIPRAAFEAWLEAQAISALAGTYVDAGFGQFTISGYGLEEFVPPPGRES